MYYNIKLARKLGKYNKLQEDTMKKLLVVFMILVCGLSACRKNENMSVGEKETMLVRHVSGETNVPKNPERVIVIDYSSADTMNALGLSDVIAAIPKANLPEYLSMYADAKYADIGALHDFDYEKINNLSPELIIISGRQRAKYEEISKIAPTIDIDIDTNNYLESYKQNVRLLASIWEKDADAQALIDDLDAKVAQLREKTKDGDKSGLIVLFNAGKFSAYASGSRFGIIHDEFGVKQASEEIEVSTHGQSITSEYIAQINPDYLFIVDRNVVITHKPTNKEEIENKLIQLTNAYKNGHIVYLPADHWYLANGGTKSIELMIEDVNNGL